MAISSTQITQLEKQRTPALISLKRNLIKAGRSSARRGPTCSSQVKRASSTRPCMTGFPLKGVRREIRIQQAMVAESFVLPQVTPRPPMSNSRTGKSYTPRSRFWRRFTKRGKRVYEDQWLMARCTLQGVVTQSA